MDYSVQCSSIAPDYESTASLYYKDNSIRVGIVREERVLPDNSTRYIVEVYLDGKQVPVSCVLMTRFGGTYNFEEYRIRPWLKVKTQNLPPSTAGRYEYRSGDTVFVAFLNGNSKEGVILGGMRHPSRSEESTTPGNLEYLSRFNGVETQIRSDGSYKVLFKGLPVNEKLLDIPSGTPVVSPVFNPIISGSYFGFNSEGSYVATDGSQYIKIDKDPISGAIIIGSGKNKIELGGNRVLGTTTLQTDNVVIDTVKSASIKSSIDLKMEASRVSLKGLQIAIGSSQFELIDGLIKIIDAIGNLVTTSPVGSCTPLMTAPTWATEMLPLKIKLSLIKGSLTSADSASFGGDDDIDIGDDLG